MLNLDCFSIIGNDILFYEGENHYSIMQNKNEVTLLIETLGNDFVVVPKVYSFSSISSAIAGIEALENGEEI